MFKIEKVNDWLRFWSLTLLLFGLIACGGGNSLSRDGTDDTTDDSSDESLTISLTITNASGESSNALSSGTPLTVTATVTDESGDPVADELIGFVISDDTLASFDTDVSSALTNSEGVATIGLVVGDSSGDGIVTATSNTSGDTATIGFSSAGSDQNNDEVASLKLYASSIQLSSGGEDEVELIAVAKNAQNVLLEGIDVSFSVDQDGALEITQSATEADGTARALLTTPDNAENRTITATATAGSLTSTVEISVVGTEVSISGTSSITVNAANTLTILLTDSEGDAIAGQTVTISAESGSLSSTEATTNADGVVTVTYTATSSGTDTITASALNSEDSFSVVIQEDEFTFTTVPSDDVALGDDATLVVTWLKDGSAYAGGSVTLTSSRGTISSSSTVTTDSSGEATFTISSNNAGVASLTASGVDSDSNEVTATTSFEFIATVAATLIADASPDIIGPDGDTSTITAVVRDADGNLVKGAVVNFNVSDVSTGSISPNQATTGSKGVATTIFTSGSVSSEDGITITATVADATSATDTISLTVGEQAFDVSIGTGSLIESPDNVTYLKEFAVFVSDSVGGPVSGIDLTASNTPVKYSLGGTYRKGYWLWDSTDEIWYSVTTANCSNEDVNGNGILDDGEDTNGDGELTPGLVGTVSFADDDSTDENGQATIELRYPREYGAWYDSLLTVYAQSTGSEAKENMQYSYGVAAEDLTDDASPPPNSPYGIGANCTDTE